MIEVRWTDEQIEPAGEQFSAAALVATLRTQPGRWAEVERYEASRLRSARSRGANYIKRYPGTQYAVREEGGEAVLYMRAAPQG